MRKKKRGKLSLSRETLAGLEDAQVRGVRGGAVAAYAPSDKPSVDYPFCWPSAVNTVCHTHCPCFTCGRCGDADPVPVEPL